MTNSLLGTLFSFFTTSILPSWIVVGLVFLFTAGYLVHFVKHKTDVSQKEKIASAKADQNTKETELIDVPVNAFDRTQRVVHWLFAAVLIFLTITGFEIYFYPNVTQNALTVFSLVYHSNVSTIFALLIFVHIFHDLRKHSLKQMKPSRFDLGILISRSRNFLFSLRAGAGSKSGKYDVFMKGYHWTLTTLLGILGITGLYFWDPFGIVSSHVKLTSTMQSLLLNVHILSASLVLGMMIGHVYFAMLAVNRPIWRSMLSGQLNNKFYSQHYDPQLWVPNEVVVKSSKLMRLTKALPDPRSSPVTKAAMY